jgi:hypothetical protein
LEVVNIVLILTAESAEATIICFRRSAAETDNLSSLSIPEQSTGMRDLTAASSVVNSNAFTASIARE